MARAMLGRFSIMSLLEFVVYLVIAGLCGSVARAIAGGTGRGFIVSVLLGFLGAFVGSWLARLLRLPELLEIDIGGHPFPVIWSVVGGIVLVALAHLLVRPTYVGRWQERR